MKDMNGKKSVLFVNNNLDTGGVQRSLINLLNLISLDCDVTLFVFSKSGEYKSCLTPRVKVMEASPILSLLGISQEDAKSKGVLLYCFRAILVIYTKIRNNHLPISLLIATQKKIKGFDTAISFLHDCTENILYGGCNDFVLKRVEATEKISFLHCDFMEYGGNTPKSRKMYENFDKIAAVSEGCKKSFLEAIPKLEKKTYCVYNCNDFSDYQTKADDDTKHYSKDYLNIITVARLGSEKGIMRGINVLNKLNSEGYKARWHIVGDGPQRKEIEHKIQRLGLKEQVFLYGNQQNPFRYIKNADVLLISSYHEAAPMVIDESKTLGVPVISTKTTSVEEMILENREGFICENSEDGLYKILKYIIENPEELLECKEYLSKQTYNNDKALAQFYRLINLVIAEER